MVSRLTFLIFLACALLCSMLYAMDSLKPCPSSPNCVCSVYPDDKSHFIEPFAFASPQQALQAFESLDERLAEHFDVKVVQETPRYKHYLFTTRWLRFKDDVEFILDQNHIHVRSASRLGYSDLGKNRKRVERIRQLVNPS